MLAANIFTSSALPEADMY